MNTQKHEDKEHGNHHLITIVVNTKSIEVQHRITGLQIKQAAISAGLNIKLDFLLFKVIENGEQKKVSDGETIEVKRGDEFDCVTNDDNS